MTAKYRIDEQLYLSLCRRVARRHSIPFAVLFGSLVILALALLLPLGLFSLGAIVGFLVIVVVFFAIFVVIPNYYGKKVYRETPGYREELTLDVDEDRLRITQTSGELRCKWQEFAKWDETSEFMLIFQNRLAVIVLPKSKIAAPVIEFCRTSLIASGLPEPRRFRK